MPFWRFMLNRLTLTQMAAELRSGRASSQETVEAHLRQIDAQNSRINAFVSIFAEEARAALLDYLLPRATLITPNLQEAAELTGVRVVDLGSMREAARSLGQRTGAAVLVKGGHLEGDAVDILWDGAAFHEYRAPRVETVHTHGTGCTYSAAITALLALAYPLPEAVARAKTFITEAIRTSPGLGSGRGPVNHHARPLQ